MTLRPIRFLAIALALVLATAAEAQYPPPPGEPPPAPAAALYAPPQLDQMLASIALYPDPLLTSMLIAATYPIEVDDAARWLQDPQSAALNGPALAAALASQSWDPSVKSLVPFPQVLALMDAHLDWTQALGNAFLAQQADVMDSIQRLRHEAQAAGTLVSTPQATVTVDGADILITPASPEVVYVPVYSPMTVYGAWPYPADQPIYYGPPPGYGVNLVSAGIDFGIGIGVVDALWNWGRWDWRDHQVHVDPARFNHINVGQPAVTATQWQHAPEHRQGVPYRDPASRARFEAPLPGSPDARRQYRGYAPQPAQQQAAPPQQQRQERPATPPAQQLRAPSPPPQAASVLRPPPPPPAVTRVQPPRPATAFQSLAPGAAAAAHAQRGQQSRQAPPLAAAAPAAQPRPQAQRPAPTAAPAAQPRPQPQRPAPAPAPEERHP